MMIEPRFLWALLVFVGLAETVAGCSSRLSDEEIRDALSDQLDRPSCFTDVEYRSFPAEPATEMTGNDHPNFDALVEAGLATRAGKLYALTPAGRAAYHPERNGFCYSAGYEIKKVLDVTQVPDGGNGSVADEAWSATLSIAQKPIASWARNPAITRRAIDRRTLSTDPQTYHVILAHLRGEDGIKREDPMFILPSGFSY